MKIAEHYLKKKKVQRISNALHYKANAGKIADEMEKCSSTFKWSYVDSASSGWKKMETVSIVSMRGRGESVDSAAESIWK